MRRACEQGSEAGWHGNRGTDQRLDDAVEFGRMCRGDYGPVALGALPAQSFEQVDRRGGVRAEDFAVTLVAFADRRADRRVVDRHGDELAAQSGGVRIQPCQPLEVARRADVHRVRDRCDARLCGVVGAGEEVRQHAVGVGRECDASDRQTAGAREYAGDGIAEVAGRHDEVEGRTACAEVLQRGIGVVAHLRQQTAEADAVGGTERRDRTQRVVAQRLLGHTLTVVERAVDAQGAHIAAECAQLVRLAWRDAAVGIEDRDLEAGQSGEGCAYSRAGVARGRDDDRQRLVRLARKPLHAGGEEARAEILERGGGSVEQFEYVVAWRGQRAQRRVEGECLRADRRQFGCERVVDEERREQARGDGGQVVAAIEVGWRKLRQRLRHV